MWPFRPRADEDFGSEIEAHLALETDRLIAEGMSAADARYAAVRRFGNVTAARERFYESRRILWLDEVRQDARCALRAFRKSPVFTVVAVLTLAVGIGANTAIFGVVNAVLFRPLPYRDPGSLVFIDVEPLGLSPGWLTSAWRERSRALADLAGFNGPRASTLVDRGEPRQVLSAQVSWNFVSFLGAAPPVGRDFSRADVTPNAPAVALLSHDLWMRRFGGDRAILGRMVTLNRESITVVGVLAPGFRFPTGGALPATAILAGTQPDIVRPAAPRAALNVLGRLAAGVTTATASRELLGIFRQSGHVWFRQPLLDRAQISVAALQDRLVGSVRRRLLIVMAAVAFVLLVACANVANLLLARASARQREIAVRAALGAGRGRLARLVLTESILLALIGSVAALLLSQWTIGIARVILADRVPYVSHITLDWWLLAFNAVLAVLTGACCGLVSLPAVARVSPAAIFGAAGAPGVTARTALRRVLLAVEVAVTFVLLVGAGLLVQTFWNLTVRPHGFDGDRVLTARVSPGLPAGLDRTADHAGELYFAAFFTDLAERLRRLPGVTSSAAVSSVPLGGTSVGLSRLQVEGQAVVADSETTVPVATVTPGYFDTLRIGLVGRDFNAADRLGSQPVGIVNRRFQTEFAPGKQLVGHRIVSGDFAVTIVGVAEDVPERSFREPPRPIIYIPIAQMAAGPFGFGQLTMVLRVRAGDSRALATTVRAQIWALDRNIVIDEIATMNDRVAANVRAERDNAVLFALFALAAAIMAAIGVYGVAAYAVAQRTKEIGIRMALGATRRDVVALIVSHTMRPTLAGLAIGVVAASLSTRVVASMVYGVSPLDAATFAASALGLAAVALVSTYFPTRRAMVNDRLAALRYE